MTTYVLPYKRTSESAKVLANYLGATLISPDAFSERVDQIRDDDMVINWGAGYFSNYRWRRAWLNAPQAIEVAVAKETALQRFAAYDVPHPEFTTDIRLAQRWANGGAYVVARTVTGGMMGRGILLAEPGARVPDARLYTKHVGHKTEYRIHVVKGRVVNVGKKFKDGPDANEHIRNWGDWKFCNPDQWPDPVATAGIKAVAALGLDFGAADIGWNRDTRQAHVFEVNTAPGTGHNTITRYADAFARLIAR